jgi:predicted dienelactone hydrolase
MPTRLLSVLTLLALAGHRSFAQPPAAPVPVPALYAPAPGPLAIATRADLKLHDAARNKDLPVTAVFPTAPGPYPVIIWSHGYSASPNSYATYAQHWASEGYVVLEPVHADSSLFQGVPNDLSDLGPGILELMRDPDQWINRLTDIKLLLAGLGDLPKQAPELAGKLDTAHLGLGGHSFGAWTAEVIGGATLELAGHTGPQSFADPRIKALVAMSATAPGQMGLTMNSYTHLNLPMLTMDGTRDPSLSGLGPEAKKLAFDLSPAGDKYHIRIEGASHFTFNDFPEPAGGVLSPDLQRHDVMQSWADTAALAFWDTYLKNKPEAKAYLQSDALIQTSYGKVEIYKR